MTKKELTSLFKRFLITFVCCLPLFFVIGFLLQGKISDVVMVVIFVTLGGLVFALEEYISYIRRKKREQLKQDLKNNKNKKQ